MKVFFKILLLILAVFPIWLTIVALADSVDSMIPSSEWKSKLNEVLLDMDDRRRIQIIELLATRESLDSKILKKKFVIDLTRARERGISILALQFYEKDGTLSKVIKLPAKLLIQTQVPVAQRTLGRDTMIQPSDFELTWRDMALISSPTASPKELEGRIVRNQIPDGDVISESSLQKRLLVAKGDRVHISVVAPGLKLNAIGIASESGGLGDNVRVINPESKREIVGTITDHQSVEVRL